MISTSPTQQRAVAWMKAAGRPVRDATVAVEAIAWAKEMPQIEEILGSETWLALGGFLSSLSSDVDQQTLQDQPLLHQLLAGEVAWTLATSLPHAPFSRRLERAARAAISLGLGKILDRQGMLPAEHFRILRPLLACWTRCRALAAGSPRGGLGPRAEQRYQRLVRNALRCTRPDGRPLFGEEDSDSREGVIVTSRHSPCAVRQAPLASEKNLPLERLGGRQMKSACYRRRDSWERELFEFLLKEGADEINRSLAAIALPKMSPGAAAKVPTKTADLPPPSIYCEKGAIAVMRRNWNRDNERIAVLFAGQTCELELVASGQIAASGAWRFEITQQGQQLQPISPWKSSCWYTDEDVDYLELEIELTAGVRIERQIVLVREDRFVFLADALMSPQPGNLEYRSVLPLAPTVEFRGAAESHEGVLCCPRPGVIEARSASKAMQDQTSPTMGTWCPLRASMYRPLAQVLPLALPEWRAEQHQGELTATAEGLELRQSTAGQRLFAPLFIDLDRSRFRRRMTWRQLTVAESLTPLLPDVAVGFRVAIGDRQWIIYRSLAARGNRTLLGHNLATDSLIARFGKDGEVTSIVEIE